MTCSFNNLQTQLIFSSLNKKPLYSWGKSVRCGSITRLTDEDINKPVLQLSAGDTKKTFITISLKKNVTINNKLPIFVLIVKNMYSPFAFDVQVKDDKDMWRRFSCGTTTAETRISPYTCLLPLSLDHGWNYIQIDLADLIKKSYGTQYAETLRLQIYPNCRIYRIYFADQLCPIHQLPEELTFIHLEKDETSSKSIG
ncbi:cilia- and flagella-associated protein 20-like [Teleopsis dalmanni]|uniref:cilia- and flagella-associated protein 20-like n=1 Tax=Teleopsis dalmanni TaxID=139649 RepID=UPI0018CD1BF6|nr:cilia- and flagella-associated protein 20-like [Teleopsis dalmanni]